MRLTLLSDTELEVIRAYGVINEEKRSVPHPTAILIGRDGRVRWIRIDRDFRKRPAARELLDQLRRLEPGG